MFGKCNKGNEINLFICYLFFFYILVKIVHRGRRRSRRLSIFVLFSRLKAVKLWTPSPPLRLKNGLTKEQQCLTARLSTPTSSPPPPHVPTSLQKKKHISPPSLNPLYRFHWNKRPMGSYVSKAFFSLPPGHRRYLGGPLLSGA